MLSILWLLLFTFDELLSILSAIAQLNHGMDNAYVTFGFYTGYLTVYSAQYYRI